MARNQTAKWVFTVDNCVLHETLVLCSDNRRGRESITLEKPSTYYFNSGSHARLGLLRRAVLSLAFVTRGYCSFWVVYSEEDAVRINQYNGIQHNKQQYSTGKYCRINAIQFNAIRHDVKQYNGVQYNTIPYSI